MCWSSTINPLPHWTEKLLNQSHTVVSQCPTSLWHEGAPDTLWCSPVQLAKTMTTSVSREGWDAWESGWTKQKIVINEPETEPKDQTLNNPLTFPPPVCTLPPLPVQLSEKSRTLWSCNVHVSFFLCVNALSLTRSCNLSRFQNN